jgi:hypothetical protein
MPAHISTGGFAKEETIRPSAAKLLLDQLSQLYAARCGETTAWYLMVRISASLYLNCTNWILHELPDVHPLD